MAGENPEAPVTGGDWEFMSKDKKTRGFIVIAGPAMNIALSVVLIACLAGFEGIDTVGPPLILTFLQYVALVAHRLQREVVSGQL